MPESEPFMRTWFIPIMAIVAIATVSGCTSNTTPGQNRRPGWTNLDRGLDKNGKLTRAGVEQHRPIGPYTGDKIG